MTNCQNEFVGKPCKDAYELHRWVHYFLKINIPRASICPHHAAPFDYLKTAYFEPSEDQIVWAPRGGGKTRLAAAATLLDLIHKPGASIRILGGSLEQSLRMWEHLLPDVQQLIPEMLSSKKSMSRRIDLIQGSSAAILTQSQRAVRGLRVQKLRCDEVEMFDPHIWEAAQLVTRSIKGARGSVDALSTLHHPWGLMSRIIDEAQARRTRIVRWCLLEVLEKCPEERDCKTCPLWAECQGVAKVKCDGFFKIDDAIAMKHRVSAETWNSEVLCKRPMQKGVVFSGFSKEVHVCEEVKMESPALTLSMDFGYANPFVCLWIRSDGRVTHVIDEYIQQYQPIETHLQVIARRGHGETKDITCDPAGKQRNDQTGASNVAVLKAAGYQVRHRTSFINDGIELIRAALNTAMGETNLFIHPRCKKLIKAMQAYHYPKNGGELPEKDGEHDHPIDALRYYFINQVDRQGGIRRY